MKTRSVGLLIFDEVEVLDFAGPFEVFNVAGRREGKEPFKVFTISQGAAPVKARGALEVKAHHTIANHPDLDILVIPGGYGTRALLENGAVLGWIREQAKQAEYLLSVCTGALVLGKAGLLDGREAATHFMAYDVLEEVAPKAAVKRGARLVKNEKLWLSAGVAAGIDMSFALVAELCGQDMAEEAARYIEYPWPR